MSFEERWQLLRHLLTSYRLVPDRWLQDVTDSDMKACPARATRVFACLQYLYCVLRAIDAKHEMNAILIAILKQQQLPTCEWCNLRQFKIQKMNC